VSSPELLRWAEIDLAAVGHNVGQLRARLSQGTVLAAVVKANGYGHGAVQVAQAAVAAGAEWLCVATAGEAAELRGGGLRAPILNMGPTLRGDAEAAVAWGIRCCVYEREGIELLAQAAAAAGRPLAVHLKVDTGMSRLGAPLGETLELARLIETAPYLRLEALWTHLAEADDANSPRSGGQLARFLAEVDLVRRAGIKPPMLHCASSAAALLNPPAHLSLVRCGLPIYGYSSTAAPVPGLELRPVMTWKSRVVAVRRLAVGDRVGYGGTFIAEAPMVAATVALGYADGYSRRLSNQGRMLVGGSVAPVVGRVSMDFVTLDVTDVSGVAVGDEVVVIGRQGKAFIGADEMARSLDTIAWEVLATVGARVIRVPVLVEAPPSPPDPSPPDASPPLARVRDAV
jgi:alanine racemase